MVKGYYSRKIYIVQKYIFIFSERPTAKQLRKNIYYYTKRMPENFLI